MQPEQPPSTARPDPAQRSLLPGRHHLRRFLPQAEVVPRLALGDNPPSNPFGNCLALLPMPYADQVQGVAQPTAALPGLLPAGGLPAAGLTIELWFNAHASGVLLGLPVSLAASTTTLAPLLWVNAQGQLSAGLFDGSALDLVTPAQTLLLSTIQVSGSGPQSGQSPPFVGPANPLVAPLSVVDGDWHHAALVVTSGLAQNRQSLYLDGRLVATASGSFGLGFSDTSGNSYSAGSNGQLGGSIVPQPLSNPRPAFTYPEGFEGLIDELRVWQEARSPAQIQAGLAGPLDLAGAGSTLFAYWSFDAIGPNTNLSPPAQQLAGLSGSYIQSVVSTIPFDSFSADQLPGYQNYGLRLATPYTSPSVTMSFAGAGQPTSLKASLRLGDLLQLTCPTIDDQHDLIQGSFALTVTGSTSGQAVVQSGIQPGSVVTIQAQRSDAYRLDLSCSTAVTASVQFTMLPGPTSSLMQLLLNFGDPQAAAYPDNALMAYSDPRYPTAAGSTADPRSPGKFVPTPAYWPLFANTSVFGTTFSADELLVAYLELVGKTPTLLSDQSTFGDYMDLLQGGHTALNPDTLDAALQQAYTALTGSSQFPSGPSYASAVDQVFVFLTEANQLRRNLLAFLNTYQSWAINNLDALLAKQIPAGVANMLYNAQGPADLTLSSHISWLGFAINLIVGAVLWGLGAIVPGLLPAEVAVTVTLSAAFAGSAGASVFSELLGTFVSSSATQLSRPSNLNNYVTLEQLSQGITADLTSIRNALVAMLDTRFQQAILSNYGLLQAFQAIDAAGLDAASADETQQLLSRGLTYTSWQSLVPAIFSWKAETLPDNLSYEDLPGVYTPLARIDSTSNQVDLSQFFAQGNDPQLLGGMLFTLQLLQQRVPAAVEAWQKQRGATTLQPGEFFTICALNCPNVDGNLGYGVVSGVINRWYLVDRNGHAMAASLTVQLFGVGSEQVRLTPAARGGSFFAPAGGGWYWNTLPPSGAVTSWYDAFVNWAANGPPSYSPIVLLSQPTSTWISMQYVYFYKVRYLPLTQGPPAWAGPAQLVVFSNTSGNWQANLAAAIPLLSGTPAGLPSMQMFARGLADSAENISNYLYLVEYVQASQSSDFAGLNYSYKISGNPALAVSNPGTPQSTVHVYALDASHGSLLDYTPPTRGSNWQVVSAGGKNLAGNPVPIAFPDKMQVYLRDTFGNLILFEEVNNKWSNLNLSQLAGPSAPPGTPSIVGGDPVVFGGLGQIYAAARSGSLIVFSYANGTWALNGVSIGGSPPGPLTSTLVGFLDQSQQVQLFATTNDKSLVRIYQTGGGWLSQTLSTAGQQFGGAPALPQDAGSQGVVRVYAIDTSGALYEFASADSSMSSWTATNISAQTGGPMLGADPLVIDGATGPAVFGVALNTPPAGATALRERIARPAPQPTAAPASAATQPAPAAKRTVPPALILVAGGMLLLLWLAWRHRRRSTLR